ncbi:hypothetical protein RRG08_024069 [Elysia crispata]|uniref:Uncharacterized protein n=1 Tax=Elysia crispata TaxID=231223 RepID=A0AAE0ZNV0_9GAST|nr:hypothetical protein RRG08_024069 [Elysia crispata]
MQLVPATVTEQVIQKLRLMLSCTVNVYRLATMFTLSNWFQAYYQSAYLRSNTPFDASRLFTCPYPSALLPHAGQTILDRVKLGESVAAGAADGSLEPVLITRQETIHRWPC